MEMNDNSRICSTCFHHCRLLPGQTGRCRARQNKDGRIISMNYGRITALALDPIEKKPLKMFHPGTRILSAGSYGCNLSCPFCQNYEISQTAADSYTLSPELLAAKALELRKNGNIGVAFTYNEPLIGWEYIYDTAKIVHSYQLYNVIVTNGTVDAGILEKILPYTDAMNIDLKGFTPRWYHTLGGSLDIVKQTIKISAAFCHIELTTLIVPGCNDTPQEMKELSSWVASVDENIPLHITRFFPRYKMNMIPPTDTGTLFKLAETARKNLKNVFIGNC
jgi:pyruvate formate lyase activating enzyme